MDVIKDEIKFKIKEEKEYQIKDEESTNIVKNYPIYINKKIENVQNKECKDIVLEEAHNNDNHVFTSEEIKDLLSCDICSDICKRGIIVHCCNSQACRVCATKKISQFSNKCWCCGKNLVQNDFQTDYDLRLAVLEHTANKPHCQTSQAFFKRRKRNLELTESFIRNDEYEKMFKENNPCSEENGETPKRINSADEIIRNPDECKVFIGLECIYCWPTVNCTQIGAISSGSDQGFHAINNQLPFSLKDDKILKFFNFVKIDERVIRILEDGTQLQTSKQTCRPDFFVFLQQLVIDKQELGKKITLVLYSKYELWCILSIMKWDLLQLNVNIICLHPEDHPTNLSNYSNENTDSMLQVAKMIKDHSSSNRGAVKVPLSAVFMNRTNGVKTYSLISAMNIPESLLLYIDYWHGEDETMRGLKSCAGVTVPIEHYPSVCKYCIRMKLVDYCEDKRRPDKKKISPREIIRNAKRNKDFQLKQAEKMAAGLWTRPKFGSTMLRFGEHWVNFKT